MVHIKVSAIDYLLHEGTMLYNFQVCFGRRLAWVVTKSYDDFVNLHMQLERHYDALVLPQLAAQVWRWARNTAATATVRLPKLESYINEALSASPFWSPRLYDITVPDPDGGGDQNDVVELLSVNKFLCLFLDVQAHVVGGTSSSLVTSMAPQTDLLPPLSSSPPPPAAAVVPKASVPHSSSASLRDWGVADSTKPQLVSNEYMAPLPTAAAAAASSLPPPSVPPTTTTTTTTTPESKAHSIIKRSLHCDSEGLALVAAVSTITAQMLLNVNDFSIVEGDHIEYFLHVSLCGHEWVVTKRFSQFTELHNSLVEVYGVGTVPLLSYRMVPSWRKLTIETGKARMKCFNQYLQEVVANVDRWEPRGLLANFDLSWPAVRGGHTSLTVYVNQILFDFLNFSAHIHALSGEAAAKVVVEHRATLPESAKMTFDKRSLKEKRLRMREKITRNAQRLQRLSDNQLQKLLDRIALLEDDRDIMHAFKRLLMTGEVDVDSRSSFADAVGNGTSEEDVGKEGRQPLREEGECMSVVVGVTALQLAKITERLFFNDSKMEAIRIFAGFLINADDLQDVFDTLWFNWEEAREEVEQILSR